MKKLISLVCTMALLLSAIVLPVRAKESSMGSLPKTGIAHRIVVINKSTMVIHDYCKEKNINKVLNLLNNFPYTSSEDVSDKVSPSEPNFLNYEIIMETTNPNTSESDSETYGFESDSLLIGNTLYRGEAGYFDELIDFVSREYIEYPLGEGTLSFFVDEEDYLTLCETANLKGDVVIPDTVNGKPIAVLFHQNHPSADSVVQTYTPLWQAAVTSWTLPATLKKIGYFGGDALKEVIFQGDGPEVLPAFCFEYAQNLERVVLPKKVKEMDTAFGMWGGGICNKNIKEIVLDPANPYFVKDAEGIIYTKDKTKLVTAAEGAAGRTVLTIPDTVTEVADGAIGPNVHLQKIYGGSRVKKLSAKELSGCKELNPFEDTYGHWSEEYAKWAFHEGLFSGTRAFSFSPDDKLTRGMLTAVLYRMEGNPSMLWGSPYPDVPANSYCAKAVRWASENGIAVGYSAKQFAPNDSVTREQMACMLYRYAKLKGEVSPSGDLSVFTDADQTHSWAKEAMQWAVGEGIISGKGNDTLDPRGTATRAEAAVVLKKISEE